MAKLKIQQVISLGEGNSIFVGEVIRGPLRVEMSVKIEDKTFTIVEIEKQNKIINEALQGDIIAITIKQKGFQKESLFKKIFLNKNRKTNFDIEGKILDFS